MSDSPLVNLLVTLVTLGGAAALMWMELPEYQREMIRRAARLRLQRAAGAAARSSGHRAMGDELSGRLREALAGYGFTYRLSTLRDRLG